MPSRRFGQSLAFEIANWDPVGVSQIWLRVRSLDALSTIRMQVGEPIVRGSESPSDVWPELFEFGQEIVRP